MTDTIRVVIADDHPVVRKGLCAVLEMHTDISVVGETATGDEAQQLCETHQPNLLLLDVQMPGSSTVETILCVRKISPKTNVVILTAHDDDEIIRAVMRPGVAGYLLKDEAMETVVKAVRAVHLGAAWYSQSVANKFMEWQFGREPEIGHANLNAKEHDLLTLMARGWNNAKIAKELSLSEQTIRNYSSALYEKIGVHTRVDAVIWARERGFADEPDSRS
jgi:DNA-binding NarL/FixJ family response regulator